MVDVETVEEADNIPNNEELVDVKEEEEEELVEEEEKKEDDFNEEETYMYMNQYKNLKRKLKTLLFEQECFHEDLRKSQRKLLRVSRDKSFLLDRLLQYEEPECSSSDEDNTDSSSEEEGPLQRYSSPPKPSVHSKPAKSTKKKTASSESASSKKLAAHQGTNSGEKVRCRKTENGRQCSKLVSTKVRSGICYAHRQQMSNAGSKTKVTSSSKTKSSAGKSDHTQKPSKSKSSSHAPKSTGGKDVYQMREALQPGSMEDEDDDLVIDLPE